MACMSGGVGPGRAGISSLFPVIEHPSAQEKGGSRSGEWESGKASKKEGGKSVGKRGVCCMMLAAVHTVSVGRYVDHYSTGSKIEFAMLKK